MKVRMETSVKFASQVISQKNYYYVNIYLNINPSLQFGLSSKEIINNIK